MTYKCPYCEKDFGVAELQMPAGPAAGAYCPHCGERVLLFYPHGRLVGIISLLIALGTLAVLHVRSIAGFVVGTILIWIPVSLYLKLMSARYRPPTLKRWKERRKTFFEWLYDRDSPKDLFNKRH
jgi:DNA-directed RNA polymerase subunit RPC12/RpoP